MGNRLGSATSPYLQQHAGNPVDWWEWGPDAFAEARRRDVPLLISVGYSSCHWCHVMAHESFEDAEVAAVVNELTVPVKVDREERPDVDAVYMSATQAMTGQGGWPMTVFATADGSPFLCGTYFPREHFVRLVRAVDQAWRTQRVDVIRQGAAVVSALGGAALPSGGGPLTADLLDAAAATLRREHDPVNGGFGGAPKFPPSMCLEFLLRHHARTGGPASLEVVRHTCERMARGGIYDQLTGGFARYSVDAGWVVPHFEKMLYDNALLLRVYTHLWRATGDPLAARVARETAAFLVSPDGLGLPGGGFASALDADTDGAEGLTYVWTPAQLREVLGEGDGAWAAAYFGVTDTGTFEHGTSVLQRLAEPDDPDRAADVTRRLLAARRQRPQPARDDKLVAAWNGLAITALVEYLCIVGGSDETVRDAVVEAAEVLAGTHLVDGRLRRASRDGVVGEPAGVLEDYGGVAEAFCAMHQLTGEGRWLELAGQLLDVALAHFGDGDGGFYDTADDAEQLVMRPQDPTDNASPSGLTSVAMALTTYAALTGETTYRQAAERALGKVAPIVARHARFTGWACAVGEAHLAGPLEIAIATDGTDELVPVAWASTSPGAVVVAGRPDQPGVPLLADRPMIDGRPTAYVCRGFVCDLPVTDPPALKSRLAR